MSIPVPYRPPLMTPAAIRFACPSGLTPEQSMLLTRVNMLQILGYHYTATALLGYYQQLYHGFGHCDGRATDTLPAAAGIGAVSAHPAAVLMPPPVPATTPA